MFIIIIALPEQDPEGVRFVWDELARSRPDSFPRRVASFRILFFLSETKKKSLSSFGLLLATRGGAAIRMCPKVTSIFW